ncbi:alpha/beta hydrolase [Streptomyces sp. NPDC051572]|uniref:alpha/beta fold hydrolase n=1 Tax=Streptomyces sp. NPDC051572 TaxID=3155802 RepID=UPI00344FB3DB
MKPRTHRSTLITDDGARLALYADGDPAAPVTVILSHGLFMTANTWRIQTRALTAGGYRVVRYDQRDHGNSLGGQSPPTIQRLGQDLAQVITTAAPTGPVVLGTHSMGGMAAMAMAAELPHTIAQRKTRIALISTSCSKAILKPGNSVAHWTKAAYRGGLASAICWRPSATDILRRRLSESHPWSLHTEAERGEDAPPSNRTAIQRTRTEQIAQIWASVRTFDTTDQLDALRALGDRVEIATGELDDWIPLSQTRHLAAQLPHARTHEPVPGAGHRLPTDRNGSGVVTRILARMCDAQLSEESTADAGPNPPTR